MLAILKLRDFCKAHTYLAPVLVRPGVFSIHICLVRTRGTKVTFDSELTQKEYDQWHEENITTVDSVFQSTPFTWNDDKYIMTDRPLLAFRPADSTLKEFLPTEEVYVS